MLRTNARDMHIIRSSYAVEQPDGSYLHNDGDIFWYNEVGQRHRKDGPAVIKSDGEIYWYFNGEEYKFDEWLKLNKTDEQKMLLRLQYA